MLVLVLGAGCRRWCWSCELAVHVVLLVPLLGCCCELAVHLVVL